MQSKISGFSASGDITDSFSPARRSRFDDGEAVSKLALALAVLNV